MIDRCNKLKVQKLVKCLPVFLHEVYSVKYSYLELLYSLLSYKCSELVHLLFVI